MDLETALQQLAPLREPAAIGLWPLAPGWWVLATLLLVALGFAGLRLWRRWRHNRYRRVASHALASIEIEDTTALTRVNAVLKATALRTWPASDVAPLHGDAWIQFLKDSATIENEQALTPLATLYEQHTAPLKPETLAAAQAWVKKHRGQHV